VRVYECREKGRVEIEKYLAEVKGVQREGNRRGDWTRGWRLRAFLRW
jgi:hypothetical protein